MLMIFILHICPNLIPFFAGGNECITFFVILSGFVLTLSRREYECSFKGIAGYVYRRISKFYLLYGAVLAVFVVLNIYSIVRTGGFSDTIVFLIQVLVNILLLQAFFPGRAFPFVLNGPAWFLSATAFFYVIFIPVFSVINRIRKKSFLLLLLVALFFTHISIVLLLKENSDFYFWTYNFPPFRSIEFVMGICLGALYKNISPSKSRLYYSITEIIVVVLFLGR